MLFFRSLLFNIAFYLSNAVQMIFWTPVFFVIPRLEAWKIVKLWAYSHLWLHNKICGTRFCFLGLDNIPKTGSLLVASKHQSNWETYTTLLFLNDPTFVLKRSLIFIPLFGWYMGKMGVVPIDRKKGSLALTSIIDNARAMLGKMERQIIIYPEGTRKAPGAAPNYKYGITYLYRELNKTLSIPVLPVALNSGLYWGRRAFYVHPGTITMQFLPIIKPGLSKKEFSKKLEADIETAGHHLIELAANSDQPPPAALELVRKNPALD